MIQTRRAFLKRSAAAAAGLGVTGAWPIGEASGRATAPSDRVRVGLIGCRGRGYHVLRTHLRVPGVEAVALCDVDAGVLDERAAALEAATGRRPDRYGDYRRMLDDPTLDAVIVATPDHWHALNVIDACAAGKDVYVEKPMANTVAECDAIVAAARRYGRVVQVGQQQRSSRHWREALDYATSGALGTIRKVEAWASSGSFLPAVPDETVPPGVDYDMWLGPAPARPFNRNRFHDTFRWYWDYAGGLMTDWGVHLIDMVLLAMDVEAPETVAASGGIYSPRNDGMETPDTLAALYDFGDFLLAWEHGKGLNAGRDGRHHGVAFVGDDGTLFVDRGQWQVVPQFDGETPRTEPVAPRRAEDDEQLAHVTDFVEAVRTRRAPVCGPAAGRRVAVVAHLGNIAYRTGRRLRWNAGRRRFVGDPAADALLDVSYRGPWHLPQP